jgi:hypothetical protein
VLVVVLVLDLLGFCGGKRIRFSPVMIFSTALTARKRIPSSSLHGRDFEHEHEQEHDGIQAYANPSTRAYNWPSS